MKDAMPPLAWFAQTLGLALFPVHRPPGVSPARRGPGTRAGRGLALVPARPGVSATFLPHNPRPRAWPVTSPAAASPGLKSPPRGPPRAAVDLPLTRAQEGSSETAVSEWFEEPGVRASFNLGGMTT